jgi:hypothetical protein
MIAAAARRRILALVLLLALVAGQLGAARLAWADVSPSDGSGSVVRQVNKGFALLFLVFKLVEFIETLQIPPQGGPPPAQWGSHPDPLPVEVPTVESVTPDSPAYMPMAP